MANPIYVTFIDKDGSTINSNVMIKGRENQAEAHAFNYGVIIPADKNTGRLTAIRQHEDVIHKQKFKFYMGSRS